VSFYAQATERIRSRAVRGSIWVLLGITASKLVRGLTTLILARLFLQPPEFGLFAIVTAFLSGILALSDVGISTVVIRHPQGDDPTILDTAFLMQAGRGLLLFALAVPLAFPFAAFYHQPRVSWLATAGALEIAIRGFTSPYVWTLARGVRTDKLALLNVYADVTSLIVSLVWASISPTVWCLVAGKVISALVYVVASHLMAKGIRFPRWDRATAREILTFAAGMLLSSITFFLVVEGQRLALAKFISVVELGCFALAMSISTLPDQFVGNLVEKIFFPMVSKSIAEDRGRAGYQFRKVRLLVLLASSVMSVGFIVLGRCVTHIVLGPKYEMAGWMVQMLGVRASFMLFSCVASYMLFALGFSKYAAMGNSSKLIFLATGFTVAFSWFGLREAMWVITVAPLAAYLPLLIGLYKHFRKSLRLELASAAALLLVTVATAFIVYTSGRI